MLAQGVPHAPGRIRRRAGARAVRFASERDAAAYEAAGADPRDGAKTLWEVGASVRNAER